MDEWKMDVEHVTMIMNIKCPELLLLAARYMPHLTLPGQKLGVFSLENQ